MKAKLCAAAASVTILFTAFTARAADWPGWQGPNRDAKSPDTGLLKQWPATGPKLLWKLSGIGTGFSSPSIVGDTVYVTGDIEGQLMLSAISTDGKLKGKANCGPGYSDEKRFPGSRSSPVIDGDRVYLISADGLVGCYDARTGESRWTRKMSEFGGSAPRWGYSESVLIHNDLAIITPGGGQCIVALNKQTGANVWASKGFSTPAHYGSIIFVDYKGAQMLVAGTGGGLVCVDPQNGTLLYQNKFSAENTANCPTPAFSDGYIFWANGYRKGGVCIKADVVDGQWSFTEAWKTNEMVCHHGGYVILDGYVYGNHNDGWTCLDLKTGEKKWFEPGVGKGSVTYADGMFYLFGEKDGMVGLAAASPEGMKLVGQFSVAGSGASWAHPVIINGRLYLRYADNLYCYDVRAN